MAIATGLALLAAGTAVAGVVAAREDRESAEKSIESAERQRDESRDFIEKSIQGAKGDLFKLFPSIQESQRTGLGASLDIVNQAIPEQFKAFQGGNVAAQEQLIQGLPAQRAAILGRPIDFNPQPTTLDIPRGQFQLPQFQNINELGLGQPPQQPQQPGLQGLDPEQITELIRNARGDFGRENF